MADNFDIAIRILTQQVGPEKAQEILKQVRAETEKLTKAQVENNATVSDAAKKVEFLNFKKSELKKLLGDLKQQFPELANVIRLALDPRLLGITLLIRSFTTLKEMIKATLDLLTPSEWKGRADAIAAGAEALKQSQIAAQSFWHELDRAKTATEKLEDATRRNIETVRNQEAAELAVLAAKEKAGLISAEQAEAQRAKIKEQADAAELNQLMEQRAKLAAQIKQLEAKLPSQMAAAGQAQSSNATLAKERDIYAGNVASSNAKISAYEAEFEARRTGGQRSGIWDTLSDTALRQAYDSEVAARDKAQGFLTRLDSNSVATISRNNATISDATAAQQTLTGARGRLGTLNEQITSKSASNLLNQQTNWRTDAISAGHGQAGEIVGLAASGADTLKAGGKISQEQSAAIAKATQLLGLSGQSNATILNILGRMNDSQTAFMNSLRALEQKVGIQAHVSNQRALQQ